MPRRTIVTIATAVLLVVGSLMAAPMATAATANVDIVTLGQTDGKHTLLYRSTATSSGTVSYVDVSVPSGATGSITSPNGSLRTVTTGVLRWKPSSTLKVAVGYRFSITMSGFVLPTGLGPWALTFKAVSTTGSTLSSGSAYTAAATVSATSPVPGTTTTLRYITKATRAGYVTSVRMYLPGGATGSMSSVNGTLTRSGSYVTWTPYNPVRVVVGSQLSIPVYNVQLSVYGGLTVLAITARKSDGTTLANSSGRLALIAPPAPMPEVPVTEILSPPSPCPQSWATVAEENARAGTGEWVIPTSMNGALSAYLTEVSATCGDSVDLKVDSGVPVTVSAYRMGYYQGLGARRVWRETGVPTVEQPAPTLGGTKDGKPLYSVSAANWSTTLTIPITQDWVPGVYLIRVDDGTSATYAPLTVRDDTGTRHAVLLQQATTTWSAYNSWGGRSFYSSTNPSARLSYDRPYREGQGSGQFLPLEQGMVFWLESQGVDVTYWTDNDLDEFGGQLATRAENFMIPAHDEYYSMTMRASLSQAIAAGVNVASMGANTVYRKITFTDSSRRAWDVDRWTAGENSTTWKWLGDAYASQPLLGAEYQCPLNGSPMVTGKSWLFDGVPTGTTIPGFIAGEIDHLVPGLYQHPGIQSLYTGQGLCRGDRGYRPVTITAFTAPSGARVFNASVFSFSCYLVGRCPSTWTVPSPTKVSQQSVSMMMSNVLDWVSPADPITLSTPKTAPEARVKAPSMPVQVNPPNTGSEERLGR
jgi:hypothetical protein